MNMDRSEASFPFTLPVYVFVCFSIDIETEDLLDT